MTPERMQREMEFVRVIERRFKISAICCFILTMAAANHSPGCVVFVGIVSSVATVAFIYYHCEPPWVPTGVIDHALATIAYVFLVSCLMTGIRHILGLPQILFH